MIAPFDRFDFVSGLQVELKRGATFEQRLFEFRDGLASDIRTELSDSFEEAMSVSASDCSTLGSPAMDTNLSLTLKAGSACAQFYADLLSIFDQGARQGF